MALSARFTQLNSRFDDFLFASIGEEQSGMPLSVISALARLGTDPWAEAARLMELPRAKATEALAATLARLPLAGREPSAAGETAARLILLLPAKAGGAPPQPALPSSPRFGWFGLIAWMVCLALIVAAGFGALAG
jgi:hypothetical protein